jgi:hypothetical protein
MRSRWVFRAERILSATVKKELNHRASVWPAAPRTSTIRSGDYGEVQAQGRHRRRSVTLERVIEVVTYPGSQADVADNSVKGGFYAGIAVS